MCLFPSSPSTPLFRPPPFPVPPLPSPTRMPIIDKYRDMGTVVMGKVESGCIKRGDTLTVMPNKTVVKVLTIFRDNDEVTFALPGENLRVRLAGIEEEEISAGFVLSSRS
ncbi:unnamed protein product [Closterium sp. NIES-53]